jgi:hypothetical protein
VVGLGWLAAAEVNEVCRTGESFACDFDTVFGACENGGGIWIDLAGLAVKNKAGDGFRTRMLGEEENAGVRALGGGAVAKPGSEGDAESELRRDGTEVEDDGAESSALEEEVGGAERLLHTRVWFAKPKDGGRVTGDRLQDRLRLGRNHFPSGASDFWHRLATAVSQMVMADRRR